MVIRLLHYWRDITSAGQCFPPLSHVNPETLAESWDWCYVLEAGAGVVDPGFSFIGSDFANDLDGRLEDQTISGLEKRSHLANACERFGLSREKEVPVSFGGAFENPTSETIMYRSIILPLSGDGGQFHYLMGATNCRVAA